MKKIVLALILIVVTFSTTTKANSQDLNELKVFDNLDDSTRIAELDAYWSQVSQVVAEGDFEGYRALYHPDAVVIFAGGENKTSVSIESALARWKQGFNDTKAGKQNSSVEFRLSQRIGNKNTAHDTGVFLYTARDGDGEETAKYHVRFEGLFVKKNGAWLMLMEYQKERATEAEWNALK